MGVLFSAPMEFGSMGFGGPGEEDYYDKKNDDTDGDPESDIIGLTA